MMENALEDREHVQQIARAMLNGQLGVIGAARALLPFLHRNPQLTSQEDYNLVRAIESETDDLPLGPVRELWDTAALPEKDREIARCEALWQDQFRAACERLLLNSQHLPPGHAPNKKP